MRRGRLWRSVWGLVLKTGGHWGCRADLGRAPRRDREVRVLGVGAPWRSRRRAPQARSSLIHPVPFMITRMAELAFSERETLERCFGMSSGYVLDFSDRTFQEFIHDSVGRNIYEEKYAFNGQSKARRLRAFIKVEPNHVVGKLIADLVAHAMRRAESGMAVSGDVEGCSRIAERLRQGAPVLEGVPPESQESAFRTLADSVRQAIEENQPEKGLDRLHTYFVAYVRKVCQDNGVAATRDEPAHSVLGKYVKALKASGRIESEMTGRILTYAQATMDAFNRVRNEQSLAHPNPILNYDEALLIFNHVVSIVNFIRTIEQKARQGAVPTPATESTDDIPF